MLVVELVVVLAVILVAGAAALGRGDRLAAAPVDRAPAGLPPAAHVGPSDVADVRFNVALRGYRMDEVDEVLDRVAEELAERDARIAELESELGFAGRRTTMTNPTPEPDITPPGEPGLPSPEPSLPEPPAEPDVTGLPHDPDVEPPKLPTPGEAPPPE